MTSLEGLRKGETEDIQVQGTVYKGEIWLKSRSVVMLQIQVCEEAFTPVFLKHSLFTPVLLQHCCSSREKPSPEKRDIYMSMGKQGSISQMLGNWSEQV